MTVRGRGGVAGVAAVLLVVGSLTVVGPAKGAAAVESSSEPVCIRVGVDYRAPYARGDFEGQCPTPGYVMKHLATAPLGPGAEAVCIRLSFDWRAPYGRGTAAGQCPADYTKVGVAVGATGEKACILPGFDIRAPYRDGACPSEYRPVFFQPADQQPPTPATFLFAATDPIGDNPVGRELYRTDGTTAGTALVKDINPGPEGSSPSEIVMIGTTAFFRAFHPDTGFELWKSDGTEAGTVPVKDIFPGHDPLVGPFSSFPSHLTVVGSTLFFAAYRFDLGRELWKTDGTEAGTVPVKDIQPGFDGSSPDELENVGGTLFLRAFVADSGDELWKSDGTEAGTVLVKNIGPASDSSDPGLLTAVGTTLFFAADDGVNGRELWKSNGTEAGTILVEDIAPGVEPFTGLPLSSFPDELTAVGGTLFFGAFHPDTGRELWKSNGTEAGTSLVKDIDPTSGCCGPNSSLPRQLTAIGGTVFFNAVHPDTGHELWKSDGTEAGTSLVKDIFTGGSGSGFNSSFPQFLTAVGPLLYFSAEDGVSGRELWKSNGTAAGTVMVEDLWPGTHDCCPEINHSSSPSALTPFGNSLLFQADDGANGRELWKSNGTVPGTFLVKDIAAGGAASYPIAESVS